MPKSLNKFTTVKCAPSTPKMLSKITGFGPVCVKYCPLLHHHPPSMVHIPKLHYLSTVERAFHKMLVKAHECGRGRWVNEKRKIATEMSATFIHEMALNVVSERVKKKECCFKFLTARYKSYWYLLEWKIVKYCKTLRYL